MARPRLRRCLLSCLFVVGLWGGWVTASWASLTYSNPFHPDQCEIALATGERALARNPEDARARQLVAEALLCRGLERDDPWALDAAREEFLAQLSAHPGDFFAHLYAAEALRRRFPLADEAAGAFERARAALANADVGAARTELDAHLRESLAALKAHREQFLPLLRARTAALEHGSLASPQLVDLLTLLTQTGPAGVDRALAILEAELARQPNIALDTFYRAEILRGRESKQTLLGLYRAASAALCEPPHATPVNECQRARWRLDQLEATAGQREGG